ncbi:MAG: hypothetical protein ACREJ2_06640 [Planctomycetota bacterium]
MKRDARRVAVALSAAVALAVGVGVYGALQAADAPAGDPNIAAVANVKVLSDKVEDVSSLEAWKKAAIKPGMTDEQKVLAAFDAVLKFRQQDTIPHDDLGLGTDACNDAIKLFNVYGYCNGIGAQCSFLQLVRAMGFEARAWSVYRWGVVEVQYDGGWHYFDPGMLCYFLDAKGKVESVDEIVKGLKAWYAAHPGYLNDDKKIRAFMKDPGVAQGPEVLRNCPTFDKNDSYPLNYFGWYTTMMVFNGSSNTPFLYEENHSQGHQVNITLHRGETITRDWNADHLPAGWFPKDATPECLHAKPGEGPLYYTPKYGDLSNGRVGSGEVVYTPPLDAHFPEACLRAENVEMRWPGAQEQTMSGFHPQAAAQPAVVVLDRSCGYLYAAANLTADTCMQGDGTISIAVSWDNGRSWKDAGKLGKGNGQNLDLTSLVTHHYQYRLKLVLTGAGTGVRQLKLTEQFQCSQRALPALGAGDNKITYLAGPQEGTVTVEGTNPKFKDKQATWEDNGVQFAGIDVKAAAQNGAIVPPPGKAGSVTVPIATPGDLVRLRFGGMYRAGGKNEGWDYQVSFDYGKTWVAAGHAAGPVRNSTYYISFEQIPAHTRKCLVRYQADSQGNLVLFAFRVDADYALPHAGVLPVTCTYQWKENGAEKTQSFTAKTAAETATIHCGDKPELESVALAVAVAP